MSIPAQFSGYAAFEPTGNGKPFELKPYSYTPRNFQDDDIIVKIHACGLCGTDVHAVEANAAHGGGNWPLITGHEIVGEVVKAGPKSERKEGERVGVGIQDASCRECRACMNQQENYCPKIRMIFGGGLSSETQKYTQGGFADYVQTKGHFAMPIPESISTPLAASLLCAGVTMFTPLKAYNAGPGTKVGVIGIGGLGHLGVQFAKAMGAEVWAISSSGSKREDAKKLGADGYIDTSDKEAVLRDYAGFFDLILCSSYQDGMPLKELYLPMVGINKRIVILGLPDEGYPKLGLYDLMGKSIAGSVVGSPRDQVEMLQLAAESGVKAWIEERPMKDINKAFDDFRQGKPRYRYVLINEDAPKASL